MNNLILTITATISIVNGLVSCGDSSAKYDGCYEPKTNTITINTSLPHEEFKRVFLHEFAHAKYNSRSDIKTVFEDAPILRKEDADNAYEKMANWFVVFWKYQLPFVGSWGKFFLK